LQVLCGKLADLLSSLKGLDTQKRAILLQFFNLTYVKEYFLLFTFYNIGVTQHTRWAPSGYVVSTNYSYGYHKPNEMGLAQHRLKNPKHSEQKIQELIASGHLHGKADQKLFWYNENTVIEFYESYQILELLNKPQFVFHSDPGSKEIHLKCPVRKDVLEENPDTQELGYNIVRIQQPDTKKETGGKLKTGLFVNQIRYFSGALDDVIKRNAKNDTG